MSNITKKKKQICPLKAKGKYCCGDLCEWYVSNEKYLKGKGMCAITLHSLSSFLIEDISNKI